MTERSKSVQSDQRGTVAPDAGSACLVARILGESESFSTETLKTWVAGDDVECGATVTFEGIVRGTEDGVALAGLRYEVHEAMAPRELAAVCADALSRYPVNRISVEHRTGFVPTDEASVVVVVGAGHRGEAFDACRYVMDEIKRRVPIWKHPVPEASTVAKAVAADVRGGAVHV